MAAEMQTRGYRPRVQGESVLPGGRRKKRSICCFARMEAALAALAAVVQGPSGREVGAFSTSQRARASQAEAADAVRSCAAARQSALGRQRAEVAGTPGMEQGGTGLCSWGLADLGGGGLTGGGRCGLGERAAGCAAERYGSAARSCKLELSLRLRGGGGGADSERMCCESSACPGFELPARAAAAGGLRCCCCSAGRVLCWPSGARGLLHHNHLTCTQTLA